MAGARPIRDQVAEAALFRRRAWVGFAFAALGLLALAGWYFRLQVLEHDTYAARSEANRIRLVPVAPARGLIYDRNGKILADNVAAWRLEATPERAGDGAALLAKLRGVIQIDPEQQQRFLRDYRSSRPFMPVTLKLQVSDEEAARFVVDRWRLPGVELVPYLQRVYPYGALLAHVVGYVGRVDARDQAEMGDVAGVYTHAGKTGLERYYETRLRGRPGYRRLETNVAGRTVRTLDSLPAVAGTDLRLSIDIDLQQAMVNAFGDLEGSAVALDPRTGEILAMVSLPSFDPNLFVNGISHAEYKALNDNPSRPQFNRIVLGGVAPGSTVKPFLGLAGLDSGTRTPEDKILSTGMFYLPGQSRGYGDSHRGGHGWTDLRKSIAQSVNTYYYKLALDMGIDRVDQYMGHYGFGHPTGIDLAGEIGGILPSPAWKARHAPKQGKWYPGDTVITGIGQGFWNVTPLQLARGTGGLATGWLHTPHLVKDTRAEFNAPWLPVPAKPSVRISNNEAHLQAVREGMIATVHGYGTATNIRPGLTYLIAGKTGTAQVVSRRGAAALNPRSLPMHLRHRALFIAFAPADAPRIAIAVAIEGGGYGASTAAPIARKVFDAWLLGKPVAPAGAGADAMPGQPASADDIETDDANAPAPAPAATAALPTPTASAPPPATVGTHQPVQPPAAGTR